jgi:hypothetical protein
LCVSHSAGPLAEPASTVGRVSVYARLPGHGGAVTSVSPAIFRKPRLARQVRAAQGSLNRPPVPGLPPACSLLLLRSFECGRSDARHAASSEACWRPAVIDLPRLPAGNRRWRARRTALRRFAPS